MTSEEALVLVERAVYRGPRTKRSLNSLQRTVFRYAWEEYSYTEMARQLGYELSYVKQTGSQLWRLLSQVLGEKVTKHNLRLVLQRYLHLTESDLPGDSVAVDVIDWGDAVDVSHFYGRRAELEQLVQWVLSDRCRLIGIFGLGGMGKTALSIRLAQQLAQRANFSRIVWRSLRDAPPLSALIADLLRVLSTSQGDIPGQSIGQQISAFIDCLRQHRCLVVLDNGETVISPTQADSPSAYELSNYELFWQQLGQVEHQSSVVLTSREKPTSIASHEGNRLPVRSLCLHGLPAELCPALFGLKGNFTGTEQEWEQVAAYYAGNPLALKMIAAVVQDLFEGQLGSFLDCLQAGTAIFGDIQDLLSQQVERLSVLQQQTLDWLAIARQPVTLSQLRAYFFPGSGAGLSELLTALSALERRSLIEKLPPSPSHPQPSFTLQPVIMEYVTQRLIERVCEQLLTPDSLAHSPLVTHALIQAQARDYIRETQTRLILKPIADRLLMLSGPAHWGRTFRQWLDKLRQEPSETGYAGGNLLNLLIQMQIDLSDWDFSQLPVWSAYLKGVNLHRVSFAESDLSRSVFSDTLGQVLTVAFSPDGKLLATGDINHDVQLWRVADGKPLLNFTMDEGWVWSLAFSPDGKRLAGSANGVVHLWDVESGEMLQSLEDYCDRVFSVAFSPDGQLLATGSEDRWVRVWNLKTGQLLHQLGGHQDEVRSVAFGLDPLTLASASYDGTVRLWNAVEGNCLQVLHTSSRLQSVAFSPDGQVLAGSGASGQINLWQVKTGRTMHVLDAQYSVRGVAFSPDGHTIAGGSDDGKIWCWNYHTSEILGVLSGHTSWISALAFSVDQVLASGSEDRTVRLWQRNLCVRQLRGYSNGIWSVAFHPSGTLLASGGQDRQVRLWSAQTGQLLGSLMGHTSWIWSVAFSPTQPRLASSSEDRTIRIWDTQTRRQCHVLRGHHDAILSLGYTPDGRLWSGSLDGTLKQWSDEGICLQTLSRHQGGIWDIALSPDGKLLVSGSQDQTLKLWDAVDGQLIETLNGCHSWVRSVAISRDRKTLLNGTADGSLQIWRRDPAGKYRCWQTHSAHSGPVLSIAMHPNGEQAATSSTDNTIRLWQLQTGTYREISQAHHRWVKSLTYSPSGLTLASCSHDETIKLWQCTDTEDAAVQKDTATLTQTLRIPRPYENLNIFRASGLTNAQQAALKQLGAIEHN